MAHDVLVVPVAGSWHYAHIVVLRAELDVLRRF